MGHPGGSLSAVDVLTALYFEIMNIDAKKPNDDKRDRFIMSKGHCSLGLLSILHLKGFITKDELATFRLNGSNFGAHLDIDKMPGVEMSTGSLGHGLSVGVGRALAAKIDNKDFKIYVMMGDGETQEGSIWEAAMSASNYKLDNLIGIVDRNRIQQCGFTEDVMSLEPYKKKWEAFGWHALEIDGHDMAQVVEAIDWADQVTDGPACIVMHTVKGKGVSFMENNPKFHGASPNDDQFQTAMEELQ